MLSQKKMPTIVLVAYSELLNSSIMKTVKNNRKRWPKNLTSPSRHQDIVQSADNVPSPASALQ